MRKIYSFNKSVQGYSHKNKDIVCQDYSLKYQDPNNKYTIITVADGHGDRACFRSDIGSQKACEIAMESLKNFADEILLSATQTEKNLTNIQYCNGFIKYLTDIIIKKWVTEVVKHHKENPPKEQDYQKSHAYEEYYRNGKEIPHIYGSTLISALWIENLLILIQQGDGGCTVFYENGKVVHPIPEDVNCQGNITTSLCGENAINEIRFSIIDLNKENVIGVFLGSDGVEDSFTDVEGNDIFYKKLVYNYFNEHNQDDNEFIEYLEDFLIKFSKSGSADDISVAGIIDVNTIKNQTENYFEEAHSYYAKQEYEKHSQKVVSMTRKHNILKENIEKLEFELRDIENYKISAYNKSIEDLNKFIELKKKLEIIDEKLLKN